MEKSRTAGRPGPVESARHLPLVDLLVEATGARRDFVQQLTKVDLLVLEDFGMKKLGSSAAEDFLEVFVRRHEAGSTPITTNRQTQDWVRLSRRCARRHRDSRSLPRPRGDRADDRQELSAA